MEKIDAAQWEVFRESNALKITPTEQRLIAKLHSKYFKHKYYLTCNCSPKEYQRWIGDLNNLYEQNRND